MVDDDWSMEVEDEIESREKLDQKRKRLQRQLRDIEKLFDVSQEA